MKEKLVSARDVQLCWNPGTDQVCLIPHPDPDGRSQAYVCNGLGCWADMHRATFEQRKTWVFIEAYHLIVADGCDAQAVHRALWSVEEYRAGLAQDFPQPGTPLRWSGVSRIRGNKQR